MTDIAPQPMTNPPDDGPTWHDRLLALDWEKILYVAFIALAIVTRFWNLGDRVVSHDESLHTQYSYQYYIGDGYSHTPLMHGPFLFHVTAASYWLFGGANDFTARLPVAVLGVLLVALPYLLRDWIGRKGALVASFLLLLSPYISYYSRYIRHDIPVIIWSLIVVMAIWYYLRQPEKDKYLWWFAAGVALMFSTKEVAFIYVAIFGGFLVVRLALRLLGSGWFRKSLPDLLPALAVLALAVVLLGAGIGGKRLAARQADDAGLTATAPAEGFAANPNEALPTTEATGGDGALYRVLQLAGVGALAVGLFLGVSKLRPRIDAFAEFDLVVLFVTLVLPLTSPLLIVMAGWDPRDYNLSRCFPEGAESMGAFSLFFSRLTNATCWNSFFTSPLIRSGIFLVLTLVVAALVGIWWNRRRFLVPAAIFHGIFLVLYTSVFTNPPGWTSGMLGSLGYWLAQQEVARGGQPWFYYFFVTPFYEFLPVILTILAARHWLRKQGLQRIVGYWVFVVLGALALGSLVDWAVNVQLSISGAAENELAGALVAGTILLLGLIAWYVWLNRRFLQAQEIRGWREVVTVDTFTGFVPFLLWWFVLTVAAYTVAGEKMPWLSTHFVIPMVLLGGWYLNDRFQGVSWRTLTTRSSLALIGLTVVLIVATALALGPMLFGRVQLGGQEQSNLEMLGRVLGQLAIVTVLIAIWRRVRSGADPAIQTRAWLGGVLIVLAIVTARFTYLANFPNGDYANEFLVYAHGAPSTKDTVMAQIDELSLRLNGDMSLKIAYDNISSWPYTWYLRDYRNRLYFGETPGRNVTEYPVIIVGDNNWSKVDPLVQDDYEVSTHTFIWWPMEEYRRISWAAVVGDPRVTAGERRGLGQPGVREALWDIFWYRDYTKYGEVYGGSYSDSEWPLRRPLRLYIRKDVYAQLWDYGAAAVAYEPPVDPYAEGELAAQAAQVIGAGQLLTPRNVDVSPDGRIVVADSGNHRIAVFGQDGILQASWGGFGSEPGLFNEPWGLAVDDEYIYVADTWNHRLQKFTYDGSLVGVFGQAGTPSEGNPGEGLFFGPRSVVLLDDDRLLVTDTGNHRLQMFDLDGNFIQQVGTQGAQLGQLYEPVGLGVDADGNVLLADTWNGRIQRFTSDLLPIGESAVDAWSGESINNKPYLAVDSNNRVYVTDPEGYRVLIFNAGGQYLGRFGRFGTEAGAFGLPNGIAIDAENNVYVADAGNNRILRFVAADVGGSPPGTR